MTQTSFSVATETQLNDAIRSIDAGGADAAINTQYTIEVTASIALSQDLLALNLDTGSSVTIGGVAGGGSTPQVQTIDGGGAYRGFLAYAGTLTLQHLAIQHVRAVGGAGGTGRSAGAGGGGGGLGAGLFVASGASVTLSDVSFSGNAAMGGAGGQVVAPGGSSAAGGGGGMGGAGGTAQPTTFRDAGGGGIGSGANGQSGPGNAAAGPGIIPGVAGGGAGHVGGAGGASGGGGGASGWNGAGGGGGGVGGGAGNGTAGGGGGGFGGGGAGGVVAGSGSFGGGGGGSNDGFGGPGGFGGGGGGGGPLSMDQGGQPGFGGGTGAAPNGAGGGGLGAGGDVFVQEGGRLTIAGGSVLNQGTVAPGAAGGTGAKPGRAYGDALFIQGTLQTVTLVAQAGETVSVAGAIIDMTSAQDPSGNTGVGNLDLVGDGTFALGGSVALAGSIAFDPAAAASLQLASTALNGGKLNATLAGLDFDDQIDLTGLAYTSGAHASVDAGGRLIVVASGKTNTLPTAGLAAGTSFVAGADGKGGTLVRLQQTSVATEADLNAAIRLLDQGVLAGSYIIRLTASITLTQDLLALNLANGTSVTIEGTDGAGHAAVQTIDGGGKFRGVFAYAGALTLQDLTIRNTRAVGGAGASAGAGYGAGGGGAGLGGGLFVASGASVTLVNVTFSDNAATGGAGGGAAAGAGGGGGGGLGGPGGSGAAGSPYGGGGGVGVAAVGQFGPGKAAAGTGIVPGAPGGAPGDLPNGSGGASGGGGGVGAFIGAGGGGVGGVNQQAGYGGFGGGGGGAEIGGNGGLGGGGGGGAPLAIGGNGGFGGGGGGGAQTTGLGGFGGGNAAAGGGGATAIAGGGGLGAGGDIFVQEGGGLTLAGGVVLNQGTVAPGTGGPGAQSGRAYGEALFIQGNQSVTLAPQAGQTLTIAGTVTDMTSAQDASREQGAGTLLLTSVGTVALNGPVALAGGIGFGPTAAAMLQLGSIALAGGTLHAALSGLNFDDLLDLTDLPYSKGPQASVNASGQITVAAAGTTDVLPTTDLAAGTPMLTSPDGKGGTLVRVGRVSVSSQAELNAAIRSIDTSTVIGAYVIDLTASITLTEDLLALNLPTGSSVTIGGTDGAGNTKAQTIDGAGTYRGFFAYAGTVTLQNLTIQHARAVGGAGGGSNNAGAGGGGAGLGGGLFVASGADVTLANVTFSGNAATGGAGGVSVSSSWQGAGGGGGLGGAGGSTVPNVHRDGGGGGVGLAANGQAGPNNAAAGTGIIPGVAGGGTGDDGVVPGTGQPGAGSAGGGGASGTTGQGGGGGGIGGGSLQNGVGLGFGGFGGGGGGGIDAGDGGFGGGGGGRIADPGGHGGFGGGGGGGVGFTAGGFGGFGGGNASGYYAVGTNGGGGLGAGGDVFIQQGGRLTIEGGSVLNQGTINPGGAGDGAQPGKAYGDAMFIQGNQSIVLAPAAGQSLSISGVIADMTGSKDPSGETGAGSIVVDGGGLVALAADNTFTGGVVLQHGTLSLHDAPLGAGSGTISFAPAVDSVLVVTAGPTVVANPIAGFATGDKLLFDNIGFVSGQSTAVINKGTLTYTAPSGSTSLLLRGIADGTAFVASSAGAGGSFVELASSQPAPCFLQGTRILTPDGDVAVEELRFGDPIQTHDGHPARVVWIGERYVDCAAHPHPERVWPVRIRAGTFGRGRPQRDLFLSPDHCLYLERVLIPVKCLIDGQAITQVKVDALTYYHVELPQHDVLLAEGLAAESYLDSDGRSNFSNGGAVLRLFQDFASVSDDAALLWDALGFAPRRVTGPEVDTVRQRLSRRAAGAARGRRKAQVAVQGAGD